MPHILKYGKIILWNSIAWTSFVFTELANTMKYGVGGGGLYIIVFTEVPFKTVPGDVTAFHRIPHMLMTYVNAMLFAIQLYEKWSIISYSLFLSNCRPCSGAENWLHTIQHNIIWLHIHMYEYLLSNKVIHNGGLYGLVNIWFHASWRWLNW